MTLVENFKKFLVCLTISLDAYRMVFRDAAYQDMF